nr:stimulatory factor I 66 kda component, SFI 66 kda component, hsp60 [Saccharomyces cerevisiae=yeast, Peptide Partial, 15 aa] [Saccharomyces cerevisiae]
ATTEVAIVDAPEPPA